MSKSNLVKDISKETKVQKYFEEEKDSTNLIERKCNENEAKIQGEYFEEEEDSTNLTKRKWNISILSYFSKETKVQKYFEEKESSTNLIERKCNENEAKIQGEYFEEEKDSTNLTKRKWNENEAKIQGEYFEEEEDSTNQIKRKCNKSEKQKITNRNNNRNNVRDHPIFCDILSVECFRKEHFCSKVGWLFKKPLYVCFEKCKIAGCGAIIHISKREFINYHRLGVLKYSQLFQYCYRVGWCFWEVIKNCERKRKCKKIHINKDLLFLNKII